MAILKNNNNVEEEEKVKTTVNGVDQATQDKMNSSYVASDEQKQLDSNSQTALNNYSNIASKDQIVSDSTWKTLNSTFQKPTAVLEADKYIASQLTKIQSGKTSYSDQVKDLISQITNREKFSYDVDTDPLFQQALASAMNSGSQAMQDTIGQASALTGGYGSTYATSAGNQAYNSFIEDAYNNLPQYYQMALEAYQMEGEDLLNQYSVLSDADNTEFSRTLQAYDATYQHRNQLYNEAYTQFRDSKTDAYNSANLQISEHSQLASDAFNLYQATSDYANTMYEREYTKWSDEVNQAMKYAEMLNSDWWAQTNFDEGVRQYEQNFAEEQRQYEKDYAQKDEHFNKNLEFTEAENQKDRDWKSSESLLDRQHQASENQKERDFTASQNSLYKGSGGSGGGGSYSITNTEYNALNKIATEASNEDEAWSQAVDYLEAIGKAPQSDEESEIIRRAMFGDGSSTDSGTNSGIDWDTISITKTKDTWNGFLGLGGITGHIDSNDEFNVNGQIYTTKELEQKMIEDGIDKKKRDTILRNLSGLGNNSSYSFSGK